MLKFEIPLPLALASWEYNTHQNLRRKVRIAPWWCPPGAGTFCGTWPFGVRAAPMLFVSSAVPVGSGCQSSFYHCYWKRSHRWMAWCAQSPHKPSGGCGSYLQGDWGVHRCWYLLFWPIFSRLRIRGRELLIARTIGHKRRDANCAPLLERDSRYQVKCDL